LKILTHLWYFGQAHQKPGTQPQADEAMMAENQGKLTDERLKDRWEKPEGQAFRKEIIRQLQSEGTGRAVDWENLKVVVDKAEKHWRDLKIVQLWMGGKQLCQMETARWYFDCKTL